MYTCTLSLLVEHVICVSGGQNILVPVLVDCVVLWTI